MGRENRRALLDEASFDSLYVLGTRLEAKCKAMLDEVFTPPAGPLSHEQRRYLDAFNAWQRNPTQENLKIRRSAYLAMEMSR